MNKNIRRCLHPHTFPAHKMLPKDVTAGYNSQIDPFYSESLFMYNKKEMKKIHTRKARRFNNKLCTKESANSSELTGCNLA